MSVYNYNQISDSVYDFHASDDDASSIHRKSDDEIDEDIDLECASDVNPSICTATASKSNIASSEEIDENNFVELPFEFLCGNKKKSKILATVCDYNLYTKHGSCARGIRYRCKDRDCRAFLIFCSKKNMCMRLKSSPRHKHAKSDSAIEADYWNLLAMNEMRRHCSNLATLAGGRRLANVRSIFSNVMQQ